MGEQSIDEAEFGPHLADARVNVSCTQRHPPLEGIGVAIVGTGRTGCQIQRCGFQLVVCRGYTGSSGQELPHGFIGMTFGFLGEVSNDGTRRCCDYRAGIRRKLMTEHAQQRGLADAIGTNQSHPPTWRHREIDIVEDGGEAHRDDERSSVKSCVCRHGIESNREAGAPGSAPLDGIWRQARVRAEFSAYLLQQC